MTCCQPVRHPAADAHALKQAMRALAGGVTVLTAGIGEAHTGATVTSATALSVEPPTMIVNINLSPSTWPAIRRHGHFRVNILGRHHQDVADRFAGKAGVKGAERYAEADWVALSTGALGLVGALAVVDCELEEAIERHGHAIILGRVTGHHARRGCPARLRRRPLRLGRRLSGRPGTAPVPGTRQHPRAAARSGRAQSLTARSPSASGTVRLL